MARSCLVTNVLNDMAEKKLSEDQEDITVLKEVASALFAGTFLCLVVIDGLICLKAGSPTVMFSSFA